MSISGVEPTFGVNDFGEAKFKNETEAIATAILNLLFGRPGYFPSIPRLGLNIQGRIYMFWDDIDTDMLKAEIVSQCSELKIFVDQGTFDIVKDTYKGQPLLLIILPVQTKNIRKNLAIGVTVDKNGETKYNYIFDDIEV